MTDRVVLPLMDGRWLALAPETFQDALTQGSRLMSQDQPKQTDDRPVWLTVKEVSRLCNVSETHLRDEIALGHIRIRHFGRGVRIHRDFVEHQTGDLVGIMPAMNKSK